VDVKDVEVGVAQNAICRMSIPLELHLELHLTVFDGLFADHAGGHPRRDHPTAGQDAD
jgi:hypothetical protein